MSQKSFLLVDDFPLIRTLIKKSLEKLGYDQYKEVRDGVEALQELEASISNSTPYSMIFLDWNMPRMNGLELLKHCKSHPKLKNIPIIMISAERDSDHVIQAINSGAADYIMKPFVALELEKKITKHLGPYSRLKKVGT